MCMIDGSDPCDFSHIETRKARKSYTCGECRRTIQRGESYEHTTMLFDGRFDTCRTCAHCTSLRGWLRDLCGGWLYEFVIEEIKEHWVEYNEYRSLALGRCLVNAGRKWQRNGELVPVPEQPAIPEEAMVGDDS